SIFQVNGTGVISVACAVGISANIAGTAWFDNVQLVPLSPSITSGGFFAGLSFDGPGQLSSSTTQTDGVAQRVIAKGHVAGLASNTANVTYTQAFQNVPLTILNGGISYEPR